MDIDKFLDQIRDLTDLELAVLLSLIAQQNCLIYTDEDSIEDLSSELALIASEVFNLSYAVVSPENVTSVEKFAGAILDQNPDHDFGRQDQKKDEYLQPHSRLASVAIRAGSIATSQASPNLDSRTVTNVVIAKSFNHVSREVQIAALELITRRRIYSRTTVHQVPKTFLFIPIVSTSTKDVKLNEHLNDRIFLSHFHDPTDGFANLEELGVEHGVVNSTKKEPPDNRDKRSLYSYSDYQSSEQRPQADRQIQPSVIDKLRELGQAATMTPEIRRHMQDIIVFLRIARGVDGGVTPFATTQFMNLAKYLAPLHGINFVTPSLVALAARKVYTHRIIMASPGRERSVQWGSELGAVAKILKHLTPETVIEDVLATVPSPL